MKQGAQSHTELVEEPGLGLNGSSASDYVGAHFPQYSSFPNTWGPWGSPLAGDHVEYPAKVVPGT